MTSIYLFLSAIVVCVLKIDANPTFKCYEGDPDKLKKPISKANTDQYQITIEGNPDRYLPGETYIVSLKAKQSNVYTEFVLIVEPMEALAAAGQFDLVDGQQLATFSARCRNTLIQTNTIGKTRVDVKWTAPPEENGCVVFRAAVFESSDNWYVDGDGLTKEFCQEVIANPDQQLPYLPQCCACHEAKYEMAFQGLWSRNTHPKEFPSDPFQTEFSDIVGASHKPDRAFWEYDRLASDALKLFAEEGNSTLLENELKRRVKNGDIRTIIKARKLPHPNRTGTSYTNFRVDNQSHVISVVSRIKPSPDWIVGVSKFELCTPDCNWIKTGVINLYPWDVGTNDGTSYSSNEPASILRPIRRIYANDSNAVPFYDPDGEPIKPLARLTLTRQKLYEKVCDQEETTEERPVEPETIAEEDIEEEELTPSPLQRNNKFNSDSFILQEPDGPVVNCKVTKWSQWSSCNATAPCTKGYIVRIRQIVRHPENGGKPCPQRIFKKRKCYAPCHKRNHGY